MKISLTRRFAPLALGTALLVSGSLHSVQAAPSDLRARTQKRVQTLFKSAGATAADLHLSAAQKAKMRAIAQKNAPLARAIWNDASLSQSAKASKIRALKNEASAVLTPAQKQKMASAKGAAMGKLFETAVWISNELALTDQQQGKLKNVVLSKYRKASSGGDFGALRSLIIDTSGEIDDVLTPAQQAKWAVIKTTARQEIVKQTRAWRQMNRV